MKQVDINAYPFSVRLASTEDGGGYLVEFPDAPGCLGDGKTPDEALAHGREALAEWMFMAKEMGRAIPVPGAASAASGKWLQRVPKSVHARLTVRAQHEGVSLNTLVTTFIAEGLGRCETPAGEHKER
jgi:antitoxin HicB